MRTKDNGKTWVNLPNPPFSIGYPVRYSKVLGYSNIVWGLYNTLVGSKNFGESWTKFDSKISNVNFWQGISSPKKNVVWIAGNNNKITYTTKADSLLNL